MLTTESITITAGLAVAILVIGFLKLCLKYRIQKEELNFAIEFLNKYRTFTDIYLDSGKFDGESYTWLTLNSVKMHFQMGLLGRTNYRPAFENYIHRNYSMVLNVIPQIRTGVVHNNDIVTLDDMILRFIGLKQNIIQDFRKKLFNPFIWLREGVQFCILLPLSILEWFGLAKEGAVSRAENSIFVRFFTAFFSLLGVVGTVIGITVDWEQFSKLVIPFLP